MSETTRTTLGVNGDKIYYTVSTKTISPDTGKFLSYKNIQVIERADLNQIFPEKSVVPGVPNYKWPLKIGEKWTGTRMITIPSFIPGSMQHNYLISVDAEVVKSEDLDTPIGILRTIKIIYKTTNEGPNLKTVSIETIWYSPQVHRYVKSKTETTIGNNAFPQVKIQDDLIKYKSN